MWLSGPREAKINACKHMFIYLFEVYLMILSEYVASNNWMVVSDE
jgi:hypothetical protein